MEKCVIIKIILSSLQLENQSLSFIETEGSAITSKIKIQNIIYSFSYCHFNIQFRCFIFVKCNDISNHNFLFSYFFVD